jgi:tetratricopeptide (TPR) repeat protein
MRPIYWITISAVFYSVFPAAAAEEDSFRPNVVKVVPAVSGHYEMVLLLAGKSENRYQRSRQLKQTLPKIEDIDPLEQTRELMGWLAVTAMVESAVSGSKEPEQSWELELVELYRYWANAEPAFFMFTSSAVTTALSQGGDQHPLVKLSSQLVKLPAYARRGIRWMAKRRLKAKPNRDLRLALLKGLVEVNRREGDWSGMHLAAAALVDLQPTQPAHAWVAEALFELGRMEAGEQALKKSQNDKRAMQRKRLAGLLRALEKQKTPRAMAEVAAAFIGLDEFWRVLKFFKASEVVRAAHPQLDEAFIQAAMGGSLDYSAAWAFGRRARGKPPTPKFLTHRIGAGLVMIMKDFYGGVAAQKPDLEPAVVVFVERDLRRFRPADPRLVDLTGIYLTFLRFVLNQEPESPARRALQKEVLSFNRTYPGDLPGVQMAYLLAQLGPEGPDAWEVIGRYRQAMGKQRIPTHFLPVFVGAAVRKAVKENDRQPLKIVMAWLDKRLTEERSPSLMIWKAHLLAVTGLLSDDELGGKGLQEAVNAYGQVVNAWSEADSDQRNLGILCDAVASVSTLLMQGQDVDQAASLLEQASQVCGAFPSTAAVTAVDPKKDLVSRLDALASHQSRIQVQLWLAVLAETSGDEKSARRHFIRAAERIAEERKRGSVVPLAPDHRSLVAFSGNFNMGAGYSSSNPFGLAIEVTVSTRMFLFPPAAVDEKKIEPYLSKIKTK